MLQRHCVNRFLNRLLLVMVVGWVGHAWTCISQCLERRFLVREKRRLCHWGSCELVLRWRCGLAYGMGLYQR
jgi:hypothetical protein